jgi:hypothetical protein
MYYSYYCWKSYTLPLLGILREVLSDQCQTASSAANVVWRVVVQSFTLHYRRKVSTTNQPPPKPNASNHKWYSFSEYDDNEIADLA